MGAHAADRPTQRPVPGYRLAPARDRSLRLTAAEWRELLSDDATVARYHAKVYRRDPGLCFPWLGAISDSGHPRLRAGGRDPDGPEGRVVSALAFGWQLSRGPLRSGPDGRLPMIRHRCDFAACMNPAHWLAGSQAQNSADYRERAGDPFSPLSDGRGPAGRGRAIRAAILAARRDGASAGQIETAIRQAEQRGVRGRQDSLW